MEMAAAPARELDSRIRIGHIVVTQFTMFVAYNRPYPTRMRDTIIAAFAMNCLIHVGVVFYDMHVKKKCLKYKEIAIQVLQNVAVSIVQGVFISVIMLGIIALKKREQRFMLEQTESLLARAREKQWKPVVYVLDWWVTSTKKSLLPADY